jgi:uncharacterized repeat protein (TIGR01451 family)
LFQTATLITKAPAPVLLVDDDRFHEQMEKYQAALDGVGIPYDFWQTCPAVGWCINNSPPLATLQWYPVVVWWTGNDWYRPVTTNEGETLEAYLSGGGRVFLSSQDFLYYHHDEPFSRDHLGVLDYAGDTLPTLARGVPGSPLDGGLGSYPLDYPYQNGADGVMPMPGTAVTLRDEEWRGIALSRREGGYATTFFSFPFEALPEEVRPTVMGQIVGWISWLGGSVFSADKGTVTGGDTLVYTTTLHNDGPTTITASLSNTLPVSLTMVPGSLIGPAAYEPPARRVSWEGPLGPGTAVTITYRVTAAVGIPSGTPITNTARLGLEDQVIRFNRTAVVRAGVPDLSASTFGCSPSAAMPGAAVTCTLALANSGLADALTAVVTNPLPSRSIFISGSLALQGEGTAELLTDTVRWTGPLTVSGRVTVTYQLTLPTNPVHPPLYSVAFLEDGTGAWWERPTWMLVEPLRYYLPAAFRDDS